jgi:molybdopterin-guanine dinucleotide biosynthesis protein A
MGFPKETLFLPRVVEAARGAFERVAVIGRDDDPPHEDAAPVFGVLAALRQATERCFILAVDYPLITTEVLAYLRDRGGVPMWRGKAQVLCAVYAPRLARNIERRIGEGRLDLRGLIDEAGAEMIPESELRARFAGEPLMNVNTPQELQEAERIHGQRFLASR